MRVLAPYSGSSSLLGDQGVFKGTRPSSARLHRLCSGWKSGRQLRKPQVRAVPWLSFKHRAQSQKDELHFRSLNKKIIDFTLKHQSMIVVVIFYASLDCLIMLAFCLISSPLRFRCLLILLL